MEYLIAADAKWFAQVCMWPTLILWVGKIAFVQRNKAE